MTETGLGYRWLPRSENSPPLPAVPFSRRLPGRRGSPAGTMAGIIDSINRIDSLCASVGIRSPAGAGFGAALAQALGDSPAATTAAVATGPLAGSATAGQNRGVGQP